MGKRTLGLLVACVLGAVGPGQGSAQTTFRVVNHSDLKILDPIWTTAYIIRNHGYMIYDTLFALDGKLKVTAADGRQVGDLATTSDLDLHAARRLEFHDGKPVTAEDVLASLKRWGNARRHGPADVHRGRRTSRRATPRPSRSSSRRRRPRARVAGEALERSRSSCRRVAETDPFKQIDDYTGSGPFIFGKDQWVPGEKVVYVRIPSTSRERAGLGPGRRQDRQGRPRRMALRSPTSRRR